MRSRLALATLLAATLAAGVLAGCGAGATTSTTRASSTPATTTVTTPTTDYEQPPVSLVPSTITTPAPDLPGYGRPTIHLGDMNTPEQFLLGELYGLALTAQGYTVDLTQNISTTQERRAALRDGTLDLYPEYLNTWDNDIASIPEHFTTLSAAYDAGSAYAALHGFELLTPTPFSDSPGFAVTSQFARQNGITSLTQLRHAPELTFGVPFGFKATKDGLPAATHAYGFRPAYVQEVVIGGGAQYSWLDDAEVQVVYVNTTDPELASGSYQLLSDPKHVFGFWNVVPVTTPKVVQAEGPAFVQTIERVDSLLTNTAMRGLNAEVQTLDEPNTSVAEQFLQGNGLLPADQYSTTG